MTSVTFAACSWGHPPEFLLELLGALLGSDDESGLDDRVAFERVCSTWRRDARRLMSWSAWTSPRGFPSIERCIDSLTCLAAHRVDKLRGADLELCPGTRRMLARLLPQMRSVERLRLAWPSTARTEPSPIALDLAPLTSLCSLDLTECTAAEMRTLTSLPALVALSLGAHSERRSANSDVFRVLVESALALRLERLEIGCLPLFEGDAMPVVSVLHRFPRLVHLGLLGLEGGEGSWHLLQFVDALRLRGRCLPESLSLRRRAGLPEDYGVGQKLREVCCLPVKRLSHNFSCAAFPCALTPSLEALSSPMSDFVLPRHVVKGTSVYAHLTQLTCRMSLDDLESRGSLALCAPSLRELALSLTRQSHPPWPAGGLDFCAFAELETLELHEVPVTGSVPGGLGLKLPRGLRELRSYLDWVDASDLWPFRAGEPARLERLDVTLRRFGSALPCIARLTALRRLSVRRGGGLAPVLSDLVTHLADHLPLLARAAVPVETATQAEVERVASVFRTLNGSFSLVCHDSRGRVLKSCSL